MSNPDFYPQVAKVLRELATAADSGHFHNNRQLCMTLEELARIIRECRGIIRYEPSPTLGEYSDVCRMTLVHPEEPTRFLGTVLKCDDDTWLVFDSEYKLVGEPLATFFDGLDALDPRKPDNAH